MLRIKVWLVIICSLFFQRHVYSGVFDCENDNGLALICSAAHLPAIIAGDSVNEGYIRFTSSVAAVATGIKLGQELLSKPQTAVWQQLLSNIPQVLLHASNLAFDLARVLCASRVAENNKKMPPEWHVKFNQVSFFAVEMIVRICLLSSKRSIEKQDNKKLQDLLGFSAKAVEQARLNMRWLGLHTGLPRIKLDGLIDSSEDNVVV